MKSRGVRELSLDLFPDSLGLDRVKERSWRQLRATCLTSALSETGEVREVARVVTRRAQGSASANVKDLTGYQQIEDSCVSVSSVFVQALCSCTHDGQLEIEVFLQNRHVPNSSPCRTSCPIRH